jgi:uncharacterized protein
MREQYSLAKILGIWALAAAPMGILSWIVFPLLAPDFESDPLTFGVTLLVVLALGLVWLFVLSMIIVRREEGDLRWATIKRRLRLNTPREPATGVPRARLFLWVVPFIVGVAVIELGGICKSCGSASDHAATFSSLPSINSPFLNFAPALTNATK